MKHIILASAVMSITLTAYVIGAETAKQPTVQPLTSGATEPIAPAPLTTQPSGSLLGIPPLIKPSSAYNIAIEAAAAKKAQEAAEKTTS